MPTVYGRNITRRCSQKLILELEMKALKPDPSLRSCAFFKHETRLQGKKERAISTAISPRAIRKQKPNSFSWPQSPQRRITEQFLCRIMRRRMRHEDLEVGIAKGTQRVGIPTNISIPRS